MSLYYMVMPKVSVLLPVYNTNESHLRECIESILNQTFSDFELLIINDGSTDTHVQKVIDSYSDMRIKIVTQKGNQGITKTRNRLIENSQGEYLAVMDHDDVAYPDRLEKQVRYLEQHPDIGVIGTQISIIPSGNAPIFPCLDLEIRTALAEDCSIMHPTSMIRAKILKENNLYYEEQFSPAEDFALWSKLASYTRFHNLKEPLLYYRRHELNTSRTQRKKMLLARDAIKANFKLNNPVLLECYNNQKEDIVWVKLFGCIPFIKTIRATTYRKYYLFNSLLICTVRTRSHYKPNNTLKG